MKAFTLAAFLGSVAFSVSAQQMVQTVVVDGFSLEVFETEDRSENELRAQDKVLHRAAFINFEPRAVEMNGYQAIVGWSLAGGASCAGQPFVVAVLEGHVAFTPPLEGCDSYTLSFDKDTLYFRSDASVSKAGEEWIWTADTGFRHNRELPFEAQDGLGWDSVHETHPAEILKIAPIYAAVQAATGDGFEEYSSLLDGLGSGKMLGNLQYGGFACDHLACADYFSGLWVDGAAQAVYLAWRGADDEIQLYPQDLESWPAWAASDFAERVALN